MQTLQNKIYMLIYDNPALEGPQYFHAYFNYVVHKKEDYNIVTYIYYVVYQESISILSSKYSNEFEMSHEYDMSQE